MIENRSISQRSQRRNGVGEPPLERPLLTSSVVNFTAGATRANNAVAALGNAGDLTVFDGQASGTVHLILDVNGYFE